MLIPVNHIVTDAGTQMRVSLSAEAIKEYMEVKGLPPITVFDTDEGFILVDGFHRLAAYKLLGKEVVECEVLKGSMSDAIAYACGANSTHGLRRTIEDKRNAVLYLLNHPEFKDLSDNKIAKIAKVSQPFVSSLRNKGTPKVIVHHFREKRKKTKIEIENFLLQKLVSYGIEHGISYKEAAVKILEEFFNEEH